MGTGVRTWGPAPRWARGITRQSFRSMWGPQTARLPRNPILSSTTPVWRVPATAVAANQTVTFGGTGASGTPVGTVIITNGVNVLTLTAIGGVSGGTNFHVIADSSVANRTTNATSLVTSINLAGNGSSVGVSAASVAGVVTITATTAGSAGNNITLTGTINGSQGVASSAALALAGGSDAQATIVAFPIIFIPDASAELSLRHIGRTTLARATRL